MNLFLIIRIMFSMVNLLGHTWESVKVWLGTMEVPQMKTVYYFMNEILKTLETDLAKLSGMNN